MTKSRVNADNVTADIAGITAGTGITGGGTSGTVTITNDMATTIAAAGDLIYGTANDAYAALSLGTAGKVLKVNSGATAPEWAVDPTTDVVTTAGDLIYGTGADAVTRLGIGTASQVLAVNSGATAPEWATPSSPSQNWSLIAGPTSMAGNASITVSSITNADKLLLIFSNASSGGASAYKVKLLINGSTSSVYRPGGILHQAPTAYSQNIMDQYNEGTTSTSIYLGQFASSAISYMSGSILINGGATAGQKVWSAQVGTTPASVNNAIAANSIGAVNITSTISSITINHDDGNANFDDGYVWVYKSA